MVQPSVEFNHRHLIDYQHEKAMALSQIAATFDNFVFFAYSTDYQTTQALQQLMTDHFSILKVGPALIFALQGSLFSLAIIEEDL